LSTFIGLYNWHQKVYQWASCQNHVAMLSPIWISWSFHANPVAKFDSIKCLHHHFLFSSLLGYKLYNLDDIQNFFLLIVVYDIHSALNIEFKVNLLKRWIKNNFIYTSNNNTRKTSNKEKSKGILFDFNFESHLPYTFSHLKLSPSIKFILILTKPFFSLLFSFLLLSPQPPHNPTQQ
jgi:hypothetical protein